MTLYEFVQRYAQRDDPRANLSSESSLRMSARSEEKVRRLAVALGAPIDVIRKMTADMKDAALDSLYTMATANQVCYVSGMIVDRFPRRRMFVVKTRPKKRKVAMR